MAECLRPSRWEISSFFNLRASCRQAAGQRATALNPCCRRRATRGEGRNLTKGLCSLFCPLRRTTHGLFEAPRIGVDTKSVGKVSWRSGTDCSASYQLQNEKISRKEGATSHQDSVTEDSFNSRKSVLVSNLPPQTTLQEVESFFDTFGPLESVQLTKVRNGNLCATVHFLEPWASESGTTAVQKSHGKIWKDHRLKVCFEEEAKKASRAENAVAKNLEKVKNGAPYVAKNQHGAKSERGFSKRKSRLSSVDEFDLEAREEFNPELPEGKIKLRFQQEVTREAPDIQEAEALFQQLAFPTLWEYGGMLRVYALHQQQHKARALVEHMKRTGIQVSRLAYHNLLQAYINSGDIQSATLVLGEMEANGLLPNGATYGHLVLHYARAKDRRKVLELFDLMKRRQLDIPANVCRAAINAYIAMQAMLPAQRLFEQMERDGMEIPLTVYNSILDGYASAGDERGALKTYERLRASGLAPCAFTFSGLIKLYTRKGKMADAMRIVGEMQHCGVRHSKQSHSMLISGHAKAGDVEAAYAAFQDMARSRQRPDVIAYTSIIACFAKAGQMERAVDMLPSMTQERLQPNHYTYTALIDGWAKQGNLPKAMDTIRDMRASGIVPTVATFTVIIQALARTGQMNLAAKVVDEMRRLNVAPDTRVFTTLISGYANIGDVLSAFEVFKRVKAEGYPLDKRIYTTLINACAKVGRMQSAVAIVGEMRAAGVEPDVITYNSLLDGWAKRGDIWEAADVMEQMEAAGVQPNVWSFCTLIYACMKGSEMDKALAVLDEMERLGLKPTLEIFSILIEGWCQAGEPQKALALFAQLKEEGLQPDWPVYHSLMSGLLQNAARDVSGLRAHVIHLAGEVRGRGYQTDVPTAKFWVEQLRSVEGQVSESEFLELSDAVGCLLPPSFSKQRRADQLADESNGSGKRSREIEESRGGSGTGRSQSTLERPSSSGKHEHETVFTESVQNEEASWSREGRRLSGEVSVVEDALKNLVHGQSLSDPEHVEVYDEAGSPDVAKNTEDDVKDASRKGTWRNPKQQRMLEASKEWEAKYASSRMEEMLTFLTQAERDKLGPGYELIDSASKVVVNGEG